MFEKMTLAPPDSILGLTDAFVQDARHPKINLGFGVYRDETGATPTLAAVRRAEARLLDEDNPKTYLPIGGSPEFGRAVRELLGVPATGRAVTVQTPGGTAALRVAGDFVRKLAPSARVWLSDPTWDNHATIFQAAGLETQTYPYYDRQTGLLRFPEMLEALRGARPTDFVLLHASNHNPTGVDLDLEQWGQLAALRKEQGFIPVFDTAYQGLGGTLDDDAASVRMFAEQGEELLIASSFSKNFGLYNERVGALTLIAKTPDDAERALSQLKRAIRGNYSNPPSHGAAIVTTVLTDEALRSEWQDELSAMRNRILELRRALVDELARSGAAHDFAYITNHRGLFSYLRLQPEQVTRLQERHAIYIVAPGRINIAGLTRKEIPWVSKAIVDAMR